MKEFINEVLLPIKGKKIAVFALGKSGFGIIKLLTLVENEIYAWDDNKDQREDLTIKFADKKISIINYLLMPWGEIDFLVLSPGIDIKSEKFSKLYELIKENKVEVINDIQLFMRLFPTIKKIGITGTNGKSTLAALTHHVLKQLKVNAFIGGNFGIAIGEVAFEILSTVNSLEDLKKFSVVLELSSYQLDSFNEAEKKERLDVAILTNITKDHLDRHKTMENYINAKQKIFQNQTSHNTAIINIDNENNKQVLNYLKKHSKAKVITTSVSDESVDYAFINNEINSKKIGILEKIPGEHNKENVVNAFAGLISFLGEEKTNQIIDAIKSFSGLKHRIQFVGKFHDITFINDSKATNDLSAIQAIKAFDNIVWLAGGIAKEGGIEAIKPFSNKIKVAILYGRDGTLFLNQINAWNSNIKVKLCESFEDAFKHATKEANMLIRENVDPVVLLSPATASFDQFTNFEQRGDYFCQLAKEFGKLGFV